MKKLIAAASLRRSVSREEGSGQWRQWSLEGRRYAFWMSHSVNEQDAAAEASTTLHRLSNTQCYTRVVNLVEVDL